MSHKEQRPRFFGYPKAVEAPITPYKKTDDVNPVLSGTLLVIGAWIISKLNFVQRMLWSNAGLDSLRKLDLKLYTPRWDPMVIPLNPDLSYTPQAAVEPSLTSIPPSAPGKYRSISEYHALYLSGKLTPVAVVESLLPLIRRDVDSPSKHSIAFTQSNYDVVLEAAKASALRYNEGRPLSILDGVPTAVKEEMDLAGYRNTHGRKRNDAIFSVATESSWAVQKLEEAGGIILGKLNMHEMGADATNNNPNWGTPRNPHNQKYYTGGSSGGAAYAVSAGLIPVALGTDGGGSIRLPSSFCGIYGLKPSHGRLEDTGSTLTVIGPLAATMSDLEAVYHAIAFPNPTDPNCSLFAPPRSFPVNRSKILGVYKDWFDRSDASVLSICTQVVDYFRDKLDYSIVQIELPHLPEGQLSHGMTFLAEFVNRARHFPSSDFWLSGFNPANKVLLAIGDQTPARDYVLAQQLRQMLMQHLAFLYRKHPGLIIVTPTTPIPGWPIARDVDLKHGSSDGNMTLRNIEYLWLANFCGNPAISCPVGYVNPIKGKGSIPIGLMAMEEWGSEDALLEWGRDAERWLIEEYPGGRQWPANSVDIVEKGKARMQD